MRRTCILLTLMTCVLTATAQPRPNDDGTVTFNYRNDAAKSVQVDVQFAGRKDMTRGADGVWTVTLGPAAPDMYPYCYIVDGVSIADPLNPQYFPTKASRTACWRYPRRLVPCPTTSATT